MLQKYQWIPRMFLSKSQELTLQNVKFVLAILAAQFSEHCEGDS